jgi:hypothetical protein
MKIMMKSKILLLIYMIRKKMNSKLTENTIEQSFIDQLVSQGYTYYNGVDIEITTSSVSSK